MKKFVFRYKSFVIGDDLMVKIEARSLNEAMIRFATHYKQIEEVYSIYEDFDVTL